jgi:hypothetical protein
MQINDKDAGAFMKVVSGGGARGVAAGTGDNTEVFGAIVDQTLAANKGLRSGIIFVGGSVTLTDTKSISILSVKIEHGIVANLSDAADFFTAVDFDDVVVSDGGGAELFAIKLKVDLWGVKRYWRVSIIPDCDAGSADVFQLGFGVAAIGESAPLS